MPEPSLTNRGRGWLTFNTRRKLSTQSIIDAAFLSRNPDQAAATKFNEVQEAHETLMRVFGWAKGAHAGGGGARGESGGGDGPAEDEETPDAEGEF